MALSLRSPALAERRVEAACEEYAAAIDAAVRDVRVARKSGDAAEVQAKRLGALIAKGDATLRRFRFSSLDDVRAEARGRMGALVLQAAQDAWRAELARIEDEMQGGASGRRPQKRRLARGDECPSFRVRVVRPRMASGPGPGPPDAGWLDAPGDLAGSAAVLVFLRHFG